MNKISVATFAFCITLNSIATPPEDQTKTKDDHVKIVLKNPMLEFADGTFFNAYLIEMILHYRRGILDILEGEQLKSTKVGKYIFNGEKYGALDLQYIESDPAYQTPEHLRELATCLQKAKHDLLTLSSQFRETARGSQKVTIALICESCEKRQRNDSLLLVWGNMKNPNEEEENEIFEKHVTTFKSFVLFATDLYNFLADMTNSCPKALAQYKMRIQKFNKAKNILPESLTEKTKNVDKIAFLTHFKNKHLDKLSLEQITVTKISSLVDAFMHPKKSLDNEPN